MGENPQKSDGIEITPEMIEAGAFALIENYSGPSDSAQLAAKRIIESALALWRPAAARRQTKS
jgi:hypothetical protein